MEDNIEITLADRLHQMAALVPISIRTTQIDQLLNYIELLRTWNQVMNLTAITDDEGIAVRHMLDSWMLVPLLEQEAARLKETLRLIDVGTGAGFPGLPLKIAIPVWDVFLLDSLAKRIRFLQTVVDRLGLDGLAVRQARAEEGARQKDLREKFDVAVARAVAPLNVLSEYCLPFVKVDGLFVAMKGSCEEELSDSVSAIRQLGGVIEQVKTFTLPDTDMQRTFVMIRKTRATPEAFPRKAGKPEASPLL